MGFTLCRKLHSDFQSPHGALRAWNNDINTLTALFIASEFCLVDFPEFQCA